MRPDDLCEEQAGAGVCLTVRELDSETVLLEGDAESLMFLAKLLVSVCEPEADGFQLGPRTAGSRFFSESSNRGLYLHCLPCAEGERQRRLGGSGLPRQEPPNAKATGSPLATVEDYNAMGREVTDDEVAAVEDASANWSPPKD